MKDCIRQATLADLHAVVSDLSDVSAAEIMENGQTWWDALKLARQLMEKGPAEALMWDGEVVAIGGHMGVERDPYTRHIWFLCREVFSQRAVRSTMLAKKYLEWLQALWPGVTFESFTRSQHHHCIRWHSLLGYEFLGDVNGRAHFRLKPRTPPKPVENRGIAEITPA